MFESAQKRYLQESKYRSIINSIEASMYGREPLKVLDAVIRVLEQDETGKPISKFLHDASKVVAYTSYYQTIGRDQRHEDESHLPEDARLNAIDAAVSSGEEINVPGSDVEFSALADFLQRLSEATKFLEDKSRFSLGARKHLREGIIARLREERATAKSLYPRLEDLINGLERYI